MRHVTHHAPDQSTLVYIDIGELASQVRWVDSEISKVGLILSPSQLWRLPVPSDEVLDVAVEAS